MVVMGGMNARVGCDTSIWDEVWKAWRGSVQQQWRQLLPFSSEHNLGVSNTWFPHMRIHKYTWECKGRGLRSIIDYFLTGMKTRKQVVDVKVVRGAKIGSDHYLILMKLKLKSQVRKNSDRHVNQQIRIDKLKDDEVRREYHAGSSGTEV